MKNGLPEHEISIGSPHEVMESVVRVFTAESGQYDFAVVRFVISIGIGKVDQMRLLGDIHAISPENEGEGNFQVVCKNCRLVCLAVSIEIFQDNNLIIGFFAGIEVGIGC